MLIWAVSATAAAVAAGIIAFMYRRQVEKICRQLQFVREHRTNMKLSADELLGGIEKLVDEINLILYETQEKQRMAQEHETAIHETITNLSHDIRTPLTSLDGYFQLLTESDSGEERARYSEVIRKRIAALRGILEELFTYAKLQDKEYQPALEQIEINQIVYDVVFSFYEDCKARGMEPQVDICEERVSICGDGAVIARMLQNIIKNSLEHGKKDVQIRLKLMEEQVIFSCANDVENAENIDLNRVFDRFYKADASRSVSSTGLGLAIAKGLAEKIGAQIRAELAEGMFVVTVVFAR